MAGFVPNKSSKMLTLLVRIRGDRIQMLDGSTLPRLKEKAYGELRVFASSIEDLEDAARLTHVKEGVLITAGTEVFAALSVEHIDPDQRKALLDPSRMGSLAALGKCFASIIIKEDVRAEIRSVGQTTLRPCECWVPALKKTAKSLNHALTLLSEKLETNRISHSGNVYKQIFVAEGDRLVDRNTIRLRVATEALDAPEVIVES